MKRLLAQILVLTGLVVFTVHAEFRLLIRGVPVSIPNNAQNAADCSLAFVHCDHMTWVPFNQAMQSMYGTSGQWRSGNVFLSVNCNQDNRLARLDYYQFVNQVETAVKEVKRAQQLEHAKIQQQQVEYAAKIQVQADTQNIKKFEQKLITLQAMHQEDAFELLYNEWVDNPQQRYQQRAQALKAALKEEALSCTSKNYTLSASVQALIKRSDPGSDYAFFEGTALQHAVHSELVDLYQACTQSLSVDNDAYYYEQIAQTGALVYQANQTGQTLSAWHLLEWGWTVLEYAKAAGSGIKEGLENTVNAVLHPLETVKAMAHSVLEVAQLSLQALQASGQLLCNAINNQEAFAKQIATYQQNVSVFYQELQATPATHLIKKTTAFLTEAVLLHKTFTNISHIKKVAKNSTRKAAAFIEQLEQTRSVALTAEGIEGVSPSLFQAMATEIQATEQKLPGKAKTSFVGQAEKFIPLEQEIASLEDVFNGIIKVPEGCLGKRLDLSFEHIFKGAPVADAENGLINISGFHHDMLGVIETHQIMQGVPLTILEKEVGPAGTYRLIFKGKHRSIPKTFFPKDWTRKQVAKKIIEAYKDSVRNRCIPQINDKGNFAFYGKTKEKIYIKIVFNKNGTMITAYPILD